MAYITATKEFLMKTVNKIQGYEWAASAMLNLDEFVTKM